MFRFMRPCLGTQKNLFSSIQQHLRLSLRHFPLAGIHWREVYLAYQCFIKNPEAGIQHILVASRESVWELWVRRRLLRHCDSVRGKTISINLADLINLPPETLGGAYARHMMTLGLDPDAFISESAPEDWLDQRMAIGHDLYHVVTGFDASPLGEFGVAAFTLVQYWDLLNVFVLSFVPISLTNPRWTLPLLHNLWNGFQMGQQSKPIIGYAFELNWETPLKQVRQDLGLAPIFSKNYPNKAGLEIKDRLNCHQT